MSWKTNFTTKSNKKSNPKGADSQMEHVMISYQWGQQKKAIWIKEQLRANGFKVWMDIDDMGQKLTTSMAKAVENARVVLICMSQKYKESKSCEKEANYADTLEKMCIPLKMEKDLSLDGWLGLLTANAKYIDFSGKYPLDVKMKELLQELAKQYHKKLTHPIITQFVDSDDDDQDDDDEDDDDVDDDDDEDDEDED